MITASTINWHGAANGHLPEKARSRMTEARFDPEISNSASSAQLQAADPTASVFVEANAGSGKTRVLVNRVINILLAGTRPDRILCVTYTKAAAAEMKERLFGRLGRWSVAPDAALRADLSDLGITVADSEQLSNARKLFARALEAPGGLKIQTIHAFCENLLRRFPIEAGAPPGFETLDDAQTARLVDAARRSVLTGLPDEIVPILLQIGGVEAVDNILRWTRQNRYALRASIDANGDLDGLIRALHGLFNITPGQSLEAEKAAAWDAAPHVELREAALAKLAHGSPQDHGRANLIQAALEAATPAEAFDLYVQVFFTKGGEGTRAKRLITAGCAKAAPGVGPLLDAEADRLELARDRLRAIAIVEGSAAALHLSTRFLDAYEDELARHRALDFDDLVRLAGRLLHPQNAFSGWVGYKLDGTLEHALVDEAQDTAPSQWDMINGLTGEFFAGAGAREAGRTLFVVGDEKQSIYSFQGAEPARFLAEGDGLQTQAAAAGQSFHRPELDVSFRSAPEILTAVDAAFAELATAQDSAPETKFVAPDPARPFTHYHGHRAARSGTPGCVEFWPAVPKPEKVEENSIFDPVDAPRRGSARDVLAETLAQSIRAMLDRGDAVWEESAGEFIQRPVRPGDIGILVWRRTGGFFEEIIRQLKLADVPVAGADRMVLRDQTAVKDLLALGRFAMTPGDDLALAEILKSPFFHADNGKPPEIDDDALFDLSRRRKTQNRGALWNALFTGDDPRFEEAKAALSDWRNRADSDGLYDLYAGFLNARSVTGETRWARLFARLGEEARDPVEEFLARALEHERERGGAISSFVASVETATSQIKREIGGERDEVQVMTVHASKGLERPVIILPDTTRSPLSGKGESIFADPEAGLVWSPRKAGDTPWVSELRDARAARQSAEHNRLLYVALTRARDRLIVCGWRHGKGEPGQIAEDSWYARLRNAWQGEAWSQFDTPLSERIEAIDQGVRLGPEPPALGADKRAQIAHVELPGWSHSQAPQEAAPTRAIAPSKLLDEAGDIAPVRSPLADPDGHRFRRGTLIHKLLETLPDLEDDRRRQAAERYLAAQPDLNPATRAQIVEETLGILDHPEFAPIFGPDSRAEVALTGMADGLRPGVIVRGQVDRLVVTKDEVLIIDYKTNRPPPEDVENVAPIYLGQMAAYRLLLAALHPEKTIRCALLWTDSATLMPLSDAALDNALAGAPA
jgi:ATP-dependent helicase/nuclease subunit A